VLILDQQKLKTWIGGKKMTEPKTEPGVSMSLVAPDDRGKQKLCKTCLFASESKCSGKVRKSFVLRAGSFKDEPTYSISKIAGEEEEHKCNGYQEERK